jgi:PQQ-dependent dehydrogenase (methanol/ethanol family)
MPTFRSCRISTIKRMAAAGAFALAVTIGALDAIGRGAATVDAAAQTARTVQANWASHNVDLLNSRYSTLDEINTTNAGRMAVKWSFETPGSDNVAQITPLVVDGVMYFNAGSKLYAVNAVTGEQVWKVEVEPPFPGSGRGPAYGDGRIYAFGRGVMYAVDAKTGALVQSFGSKGRLLVPDAAIQFKSLPHDATGYTINSAPAYHNGTLYVALALSENHIPGGLVVAVDGTTGRVKWVFKTIPQGPQDDGWEIAKDTWKGGARVGGGIWTQPAIDTELGLLYANVGNPSPDYDGSARKGINLFTNAIIALNLQTGRLVWHYQAIHHDIWDWDLVTGPVLFDVTVGGRSVKAVASGGKNCLMYIWNRQTGQPLHPMVETAVPTATDVPGEEPWPTQPVPYTVKGVPMQPFCATYPVIADAELAKRARQMYFPYSINNLFIVSHGGSSFGSPAFSPRTGLLYVTGKNAAVALKVKPVGDTLRQSAAGPGHADNIAEGPQRDEKVGVPNTETVTAYNPATGDLVWQEEHPSRSSIGSAGNLATAGDLIFQGSDTGDFYAFDARTGKQVFKHTARRGIRASPITYAVNGKQYVSFMATNTIVTLALP